MIDLKFGGAQAWDLGVKWEGTLLGNNTIKAHINNNSCYILTDIHVGKNIFEITDDSGNLIWVDSIDFDIYEDDVESCNEENSMIDINKLKIGDVVVYDGTSDKYTHGKEYVVLGIDTIYCDILTEDDCGNNSWWRNSTGFSLTTNNQQVITEKNFSVTVSGSIFKVEAISLSEEKINKIIDILAK